MRIKCGLNADHTALQMEGWRGEVGGGCLRPESAEPIGGPSASLSLHLCFFLCGQRVGMNESV